MNGWRDHMDKPKWTGPRLLVLVPVFLVCSFVSFTIESRVASDLWGPFIGPDTDWRRVLLAGAVGGVVCASSLAVEALIRRKRTVE